jgi:ribose transport system substrate-binding protein
MRRYAHYFLGLIAATCISYSGCDSNSDRSENDGARTIAVIPKATNHEFWKSIHAGAVAASRETGASIIWKGPLRENDREEQIQLVETFIGSGIDAIVLAPLDDRALVKPVSDAARLGIPTVIIDSSIHGDAHVAFIASDNYQGGIIAAHHLAGLLEGKGRIILLRFLEGSASNSKREKGFRDTILAEYPGIEFLSDNQYVGPSTESSYQGSENLLSRYPEVDAIFAPNELVAFACMRVLEDRSLAGKILLVGFDASALMIEGMRKGIIHGIVVQDPFRMGYLGVIHAMRHLNGETIETRVDTGITLITQENIDVPEIKDLYARDLSEFLE